MPKPTHAVTPSPAEFLDGLQARGPSPHAGKNADLYDVLLGDWEAEVLDRHPDGTHRRQSAEMHFARVLEGRAIQDLWKKVDLSRIPRRAPLWPLLPCSPLARRFSYPSFGP